jgi:hypothetical protein
MLFPNETFLKTAKTAYSCHNKEKLIDLKDRKKEARPFLALPHFLAMK